MEVVKNILSIIYIIVCIALILITLLQVKDNTESLEDTYENTRTNKYLDKNKGRTKMGKWQRNTIILGVLFAVLSIVTGVLYLI